MQLKHKYKKRQIFYVQGIFMIFALLTFSSILVYNSSLKKEQITPISYLYHDWELDSFNYLNPYKDQLPAKRDYTIIEIQQKTDSIFNILDKIIRPIEINKDTIKGLKIVFNKNIKYEKYIETINSLLKIRVKTFIPFEDTIYYYYLNRNDPDDRLKINIPNDFGEPLPLM